MTRINPASILLIAICTVAGILFGSLLIGLAIGLVVVLLATIARSDL